MTTTWNVVILDLGPTLHCPRFWFEPIWIKIKILWWNWRMNLSYSVVLRPFKVVVQLPFFRFFQKQNDLFGMIWGCPTSPSSSVKTVLNWDLNQQNPWIPVESLQEPSNFGAGSPANWARQVLGRKSLKVGTILTLEKLQQKTLVVSASPGRPQKMIWQASPLTVTRDVGTSHWQGEKTMCIYI